MMSNRKLPRVLISLMLVFVLSISSACALPGASSQTAAERYEAAMQLLVDGRYTDAALALDLLHGYGDAAEMAVYCRAMDAAGQGNYDAAIAGLKLLDGFKDTELLIRYYEACACQAEANATYQADAEGQNADRIIKTYQDAAALFARLPLYRDSDARRDTCIKQAEFVRAEQTERESLAVYTIARSYDDEAHAVVIANAEDSDLEAAYNNCTHAIRRYKTISAYRDSAERITACQTLQTQLNAEYVRRQNQSTYDSARVYDDAAHTVDPAAAVDEMLRTAIDDCRQAISLYRRIVGFSDSGERYNACQALQEQLTAELARRANQRVYDEARAHDDAAHAVDFATADDEALRTASLSASSAARTYQQILSFSDSQARKDACLQQVSAIADELERRQNQRAYDEARTYDDAAHAVDLTAASASDLKKAESNLTSALNRYNVLNGFGDSAERIAACEQLRTAIAAERTRRSNQQAYDVARIQDDAAHGVDFATADDEALRAASLAASNAARAYQQILAFSDSRARKDACLKQISAIADELARRENQRAYDVARIQDDAAHALSLDSATSEAINAALTGLSDAISQYRALGSFSDAAERASACQLLKSALQAELFRREQQAVYNAGMAQEQTAVGLFTEGCSYNTLLKVIDACDLAIAQYRSIRSFSDAETRMESCSAMRASAASRLNPTRYAETGLLEAAAFAVDTNTASIEVMNQAVKDLSAAIQAYTELADYADSAQRVKDCTARQQQLEAVITRQHNYEIGLAHESNARSFNVNTAPLADLRTIVSSCENAINAFMELGGYRDSMKHLTDCQALQQQANLRIEDHKLYGNTFFSYSGGGIIGVRKGSSGYLLDLTGKTIASGPSSWYAVKGASEGFAYYDAGYNDYVYINTRGREISSVKWDRATPFSDGLAAVQKSSYGNYSYINTSGQEVLTGKWQYAGPFKEDLAVIQNSSGNYGFINKTGAIALTARWAEAQDFSEGLAAVKHNGKWGFIDAQDQQIVACVWEDVRSFSEGLAAVKHNGKWGFIDKNGVVVIPCSFAYADSFQDGRARVRENSSSGKYGYIDTTGKLVINYKYGEAYAFSDGLARVREGTYSFSRYGFINVNGDLVVPMVYAAASDYHDGHAVVVDGNSYMSILDASGKPVY